MVRLPHPVGTRVLGRSRELARFHGASTRAQPHPQDQQTSCPRCSVPDLSTPRVCPAWLSE